MSITFDMAKQDVIRYLAAKDDKYFEERGTTRNDVFCDCEQIDLIAAEHFKCVNSFGNDIEWSLKDACDVDPGIKPVQTSGRLLVKAKSIEEAVKKIKVEYIADDICIGELLAATEIEGLTAEQIVQVYAKICNEFDGDKIYRIDEDGNHYSIGT